MKHTFLLFVLCLLLALRPAVAQEPVRAYAPPSPNAASLGVFGQIPISEYSGLPDISIPLYTIQVNDFKLPVSLMYHAAGFRKADEASWVGLGWALAGGGLITRSKRHISDFDVNGYYRNPNRPCDENYDQEPDMFYYNVGAYSGRFVLDGSASNTVIRSFTKDNVKIEHNFLTGIFTITDPLGNRYIFNDTELTTENTAGGGDSRSETFFSTWYLSYIELATGERISYTYQDFGTKIKREFKTMQGNFLQWYFPSHAIGCCSEIYNMLHSDSTTTTTTHLIREKLLSRIDYPGGSIQTSLSDRQDLRVDDGTSLSKKLDSLTIYTTLNGVNSYLKQFNFTYDYFSSNSSEPAYKSTRLRLLTVREKTQKASFKPYQVSYVADTMPDKYTEPVYLGTTGLIRSITYPTGGATWFEFSPHPVGGGARIDRIYDKTPDSITGIRRFEYTGAKFMGKISTTAEDSSEYTYNVDGSCCNSTPGIPYAVTINKKYRAWSDFSSLGETINGAIVGYDKVVTYYGQNGENGKKESIFANTAPYDPNYKRGNKPVPVPLNTPSLNGSLVDEYIYRRNGSSYVRLKYTHYDYETVNVVTLNAKRYAFGGCDEWTYPVTVDWVRNSALTVYNYDQNGTNPGTTATTFTYGDPGNALPTSSTFMDSKRGTILTRNYYAKQRSDQAGGVYTTMLNKNMIGLLLQKEELRNGTPYNRETTNYEDWFGNGRVIRPISETVSKNNGSEEIKMQYNRYDEKGRLLVYAKSGGMPVSLVWGAHSPSPIAEVFNADQSPLNEVKTANFNIGSSIDHRNGTVSTSEPFTTNVSQTYSFTLVLNMFGGTPSAAVSLNLYNTNGQHMLYRQYTTSGTYSETIALNIGTGTAGFYFTLSASGASPSTIGIRYNITSTYNYTVPRFGVFYTSFEDLSSGFVAGGKTGEKCKRGITNVPLPLAGGEYILSWWEKPVDGGSWTYMEQVLNVAGGAAVDHALGNDDTLLDEIRLYPKTARMVTYTYKPGVGLDGKHDERGRSVTYKYDDLLRVKTVLDNEGNYKKTFDYNYKNF